MPRKPTEHEDEYFARLEFERQRKVLDEREVRPAETEREHTLSVVRGRCPKCGAELIPSPIGASSSTSARAAKGCGWTSVSSIAS